MTGQYEAWKVASQSLRNFLANYPWWYRILSFLVSLPFFIIDELEAHLRE